MIQIRDSIAHESINFCCAQTRKDAEWIHEQLFTRKVWALDTESTGLNTFACDWQLRTFQFGDCNTAYVLPAKFRDTISRIICNTDVQWIAHNGPHDIRSIDSFLGFNTGIVCAGETHIPSHYLDARNRQEGGIGHGLKDLAVGLVDRQAGKWETALKAEFKNIRIKIPDEIYKSGPNKGQQKTRQCKYSEGWSHIDPMNRAYLAYAASDPVLTYRVWNKLRSIVQRNKELYDRDFALQIACDKLTRRAMLVDVDYTRKLDDAFLKHAKRMMRVADKYGCHNINSTVQVAQTLLDMGVRLSTLTKSGAYQVDGKVLRAILAINKSFEVQEFVHAVLAAKQVLKRQASYTSHFLEEMDTHERVHPSINILGARTARMSVSNPPLQQLPTKDRADEL